MDKTSLLSFLNIQWKIKFAYLNLFIWDECIFAAHRIASICFSMRTNIVLVSSESLDFISIDPNFNVFFFKKELLDILCLSFWDPSHR